MEEKPKTKDGFAVASGATLQRLTDSFAHEFLDLQRDGDALDLRLDSEYRILRPIWLGFRRRIDLWNLLANSDAWQSGPNMGKFSDSDRTKANRIWKHKKMSPTGLWLRPGTIIHGISQEVISVPSGYIGLVAGRTCMARFGLCIYPHLSKIQSGRRGRIQFAIANHNSVPIRLLPGMMIAQLMFITVSDPYELQGSQYIEERASPPIVGFNLPRELRPCLGVLQSKRLETNGFIDTSDSDISDAEGTEILRAAAAGGQIRLRARRKWTIPSHMVPLLGSAIAWLAGLLTKLPFNKLLDVEKHPANNVAAWWLTVISAFVLAIAVYIIWVRGRRDGKPE